ncbi:MAG: MFS transporter [bacterium]
MTEASRKSSNLQVILLTGGHFINDSYVAFLAPLLPLLMAKMNFSMALAGFLTSILMASTSLIQPLFGWLGDRWTPRLFVVLGPCATAAFMSSIGIIPHYIPLAMVIFLSGIGTAAFHPPAAMAVGAASERKRGLAMALFGAGGAMGFALGPLFVLSIVSAFGLERTYLAVVPGVAISAVLFKFISSMAPPPRDPRDPPRSLVLAGTIGPLTLLWFIIALRSAINIGFSSFLAILLTGRGFPLMIGGASLFIFSASGALGGILGGHLSDHIGRRNVILISLGLAVPLLYAFLNVSNAVLSLALLAMSGAALLASDPVAITMAQEIAPRNAGVVSGMMMGLGWGTGGLVAPIIGRLADVVGIDRALNWALVLPIVAILLTLIFLRGRGEATV